ncbi:sigma-70 family RNA polymerase sigma factor [Bacteroidales bacterium OttesenSCG-928-K22]|nr:sigma-70 family RNA polymerase sigma factor [Bacteroidales bacterium OttesenSCG-928-L14]MDL2240596.1 sigma-70 family RNA polymerase sigma factor [Bacteroidales bacterium OttesenSCG-928-K22]
MDTFDDLLKKAKKKNQTAMMKIYSIYSNDVYNSCLRVISNSFVAEEVMQDSFIKTFDNLHKFSGNQKDLGNLIKRIAVNHSIDIYRKTKNEIFSSFNEIENIDKYLQNENDEIEETNYNIDDINSAIKKLPDGYRLVLNLHLFEDMDFNDIAKKLNITASTVRSQYVRAKSKLLTILNAN